MMVRTQISLDERRATVIDSVAGRKHHGRSLEIRTAVERLIQMSGQTAAQALLEWAEVFATPGMADVGQRHDEILAEEGW